MSRTICSRSRIVRKFNENIFGQKKFDKILAKKPQPPGMHGKKLYRRLSDYAHQLKEKQKLKAIYDVGEAQFRGYFKTARKTQTATGEKLLRILESRLDNLIYRAGFTPTRAFARQLVNHGHVLVDNKKISVPSALIKTGQVVSLKTKAAQIPLVKQMLENKDINVPKWLKRQAIAAKFDRFPKREEIDVNIQEQLIVEFYSR
ncbi:30S ribosomal protein S4 [Microgenomates group bacterium]|nr:30S ribosomal protein S4 [Microgenomates group bacterium]